MNERARCPGEIRRLGGHKRALGILVDLVVCEDCGLRAATVGKRHGQLLLGPVAALESACEG